MTLEQQLRDNLEAAAEALALPPSRQPEPTRGPIWARRVLVAGLGAAAAAALVIVPALLVGPGETGEVETVQLPGEPVTGSTAAGQTVPTTLLSGTEPEFDGPMIGATSTEEHDYVVVARNNGESQVPPTATVTLMVDPIRTGPPSATASIGDTRDYFWHSVTGEGGICLLDASASAAGETVAVQLLQSPSLGCGRLHIFESTGEELTPRDPVPEDVARLFVHAWSQSQETSMRALATSEAFDMAMAMARPRPIAFDGCQEGADGFDCLWRVEDGSISVRVTAGGSGEPQPLVTHVGS